MKVAVAAATFVVLGLSWGIAGAQEKSKPLPLSSFVQKFTDIKATSAQKEVGLPEGTWYEGTITITDVEYYKQKGQDPAWVEIHDWNYPGGCTLLLFRTNNVEPALKLQVGDQAVVRGKFADMGVHVGKYMSNCGIHFAVFKETEILTIHKPTN